MSAPASSFSDLEAQRKLERALSLYRRKRIFISKAAEISGRSIRDLLVLLPDHSAELNYGVDDSRRDLR